VFFIKGLKLYKDENYVCSSSLFKRIYGGQTENPYEYTYAKYSATEGIIGVIYDGTTTLDEWKAYLAENPMTIRFITLTVQSETPFTDEQKAVGNEYTAWTDGTEQVMGNGSSEYGIYPTLMQEYVLVMDIKETVQDAVNTDITQALTEEY
jgi:hypothetical protein